MLKGAQVPQKVKSPSPWRIPRGYSILLEGTRLRDPKMWVP